MYKINIYNLKDSYEELRNYNAYLQKRNEILEKQILSSFDESHKLKNESTVLIATETQLNQERETGFCLGQSTEFGILTSTTCCLADDLSVIDLKLGNKIDILNNSIWLDEKKNFCFINRMKNLNVYFQSLNQNGCTIKVYDYYGNNFMNNSTNGHISCKNGNCFLDVQLNENTTILNGSSIICNNVIFGIVVSSKILK